MVIRPSEKRDMGDVLHFNRWGFVRKVYGILSGQLILSAVVSIIMMNCVNPASNSDTLVGLLVASSILSFVLMIPLYIYRQNHPTNLVLLGAWVRVQSARDIISIYL